MRLLVAAIAVSVLYFPHDLSPCNVREVNAGEQQPRLQLGLLPHDYLSADWNAPVEIGDVGIDQPKATGRDGGADRIRPVGAMDAIDGGAEIHCAGAERIARSAGHEARQIRLSRD